MDNKPVEKLGEKYIESRLIKYNFDTHSDLSFDREGGDLIITQKIDKKTLHFIKIQSKARRINKKTNVSIPKDYIDENFVLFIYLIDQSNEEFLLCFFKEDFEIFKENNGNLILSISYSKLETKFSQFVFDENRATMLRELFENFKKNEHTTLIIDGIFLLEAILKTRQIYSKILNRELMYPMLHEIVKNIILCYNRFELNERGIACYLYISNNHDLQNVLEIDNKKNDFYIRERYPVKILIAYSNSILGVQVMDDINRFKQSSNIILVANDIIYEKFLMDLKNEVDDIVVMRLRYKDRPQEMYVEYKWGEITLPIALSMGVKPDEL